MSNTLFRKLIMNRINSPEQLNAYIRVARPSVWLLLGAIILLLVGVIVWGIAGTVTSAVDVVVLAVEDERPLCFVSAEDAAEIKAGMTVSFADTEASVISVSEAFYAEDMEKLSFLQVAGINAGDLYCVLEIEAGDLEPGIYKGEIVIERIRPITFVTQ